jgi:membrane AbrB-like protein
VILDLRNILVTLGIGFTGAGIAAFAGLPAAALVGATLAVSCAAVAGLAKDIPVGIRDFAFAIIGCSLGSSITKEALENAVHWPLSLLILGIAVVAMMFCCTIVLTRYFGQTTETAILATAPGALAYSLALAADGVGEARAIVVIQTIRLFLIITLLPIVLDAFNLQPAQISGSAAIALSALELTVIVCVSLFIAWVVSRFRVPAAYFLTGVFVSGIAHVSGLVSGRPPVEILFVGFAVTGSVVGVRFSSIPWKDLKRFFVASLASLAISGLICALSALLVSAFLSIPYGQVFVAFAPGGVEAMSAMAISLGYDPTYVAVHHLFRIFLLIGFISVAMRIKKVRAT